MHLLSGDGTGRIINGIFGHPAGDGDQGILNETGLAKGMKSDDTYEDYLLPSEYVIAGILGLLYANGS